MKSSSVQICPEHEEIANGVLDYGPGYNGTILEDTLLMFKCDEGEQYTFNRIPLILATFSGFKLKGPESKVCELEDSWVPDEAVSCVRARRRRRRSSA